MILETALELHKWYNVILTREKKPLGHWGHHIRWSERRIRQLAEEADGVAVVAGRLPNGKWLVIVDVDDPRRLEDVPVDVSRLPRWRTGPRCPIHPDAHSGIQCDGTMCRHENHEFRLEDAPRGIAFAFIVDFDPGEGTRGIGVEIKTKSYQLIPPSIHPSGTRYEWVEKLPPPDQLPTLTREEYDKLVLWAHGYVIRSLKVADREVAITNVRAKICKHYYQMADPDAMVRTLLPYYRRGQRNNVVFVLSSTAARYCVSVYDVLYVVDKLAAVTNDEERRHRLYVALWCYGLVGSGNPKLPSLWRALHLLGRDFALALINEFQRQIGFKPLLPLSQARRFEDGNWMLIYDPEKDVVSLRNVLNNRVIDVLLEIPRVEDGYVVVGGQRYPTDDLAEIAQRLLSNPYVVAEDTKYVLRALKLLLTATVEPKSL